MNKFKVNEKNQWIDYYQFFKICNQWLQSNFRLQINETKMFRCDFFKKLFCCTTNWRIRFSLLYITVVDLSAQFHKFNNNSSSVFCSCSWDWNGVLSEHPRKSFWKSPISKGFPGPLWQLLFKVIEDWNRFFVRVIIIRVGIMWQLLFKVIEDWNIDNTSTKIVLAVVTITI